MTIRFASGSSHFGFLLVDLGRFISLVTGACGSTALSGDANRTFASLMIRRSAGYSMQEISIADG